jgi:DNA-binding response OmpR family regulator
MKTILLVDDETAMLNLLSLYLAPYGYTCIKSVSGDEALNYLHNETIDIVILDVMMPEMDGWATCQKIREFSDVPILMLTARCETVDVVKGLNCGADDYVTKPFNDSELLARIEGLLRRTNKPEEPHVFFRGLEWNKEFVELKYQNQIVPLTPTEFALSGFLLNNPDKVFSRNNLRTIIWSNHKNIDDRTIDSHIRNVRDKLRGVGFPVDKHLLTVWGIGYKWTSDGELFSNAIIERQSVTL